MVLHEPVAEVVDRIITDGVHVGIEAVLDWNHQQTDAEIGQLPV
jgi:hypothetical protein